LVAFGGILPFFSIASGNDRASPPPVIKPWKPAEIERLQLELRRRTGGAS
jgi:hypothetical protein